MKEPILNAHNKAEYEPAHSGEYLSNDLWCKVFRRMRSRCVHIGKFTI